MRRRFAGSVLVLLALSASVAFAGTPEENRTLVSNFIEAANSKDFDRLPNYIAEDFQRHSQASPGVVVRNRQQFVQLMADDQETFPDSRLTVQQMIAEGDRVAVWGVYTGTFSNRTGPTTTAGAKVEVDMAAIFRVENEQIAEMWVTWDNKTVESQLSLTGSQR